MASSAIVLRGSRSVRCTSLVAALAMLWFLPVCHAAPVGRTDNLWRPDAGNIWDTGRDAKRLRTEYSHSVLELRKDADGKSSLRWEFASRGPAFNDIFLPCNIARPFRTLDFRVRMIEGSVQLACKLTDDDGAEYTANRVPITPADGWRTVSFPFSEVKVASWSKDGDGRLDFPSRRLGFICFDVKPGTNYALQIASVDTVSDPAPRLAVTRVKMPATVRGGEKFTFSAEVTARDDVATTSPAEVVLMPEHGAAIRFDLNGVPPRLVKGQRIAVHADGVIPEFAWGGRQRVLLSIGWADLGDQAKAGGEVGTVSIEQRHTSRTSAEVKPFHGAPTLFINGKPNSSMVYMTYRPGEKYFRQFGEAGVHVYSFSATPTDVTYHLAPPAWVAPDRFDFSNLDERVAMLLKADPHAYFFPRIYIGAPAWWTKEHPDQCVMVDPGDGKPILFQHPSCGLVPSWASELWRHDTDAAIAKLVAHVEASPWADRVLGYHVASGTTEEWMMWGANENAWVGYSPPAVTAFRHWLKEKYQTDDALRRAWGDAAVTLESAEPPTKQQRQATDVGLLRDPVKEARVIDFYRFNSDLVADTISHFGATIKHVAGRDKLCGVFYGYLLQLAGEQRMQNAGHLAVTKVIRCPDIDFMTSPTSYAFRSLGDGYSHFMSLTNSVRLHGKLWFDENDIRTYLLKDAPIGQWGRYATYEESLSQQRREIANVLCHACGMWWFDMGGGWYDDPRMMTEIGKMKAIADSTVNLPRDPVDEIAVVVDGLSHIFLEPGNGVLGRYFIMQQLPQLGRIGAPIGFYDVNDLPALTGHRMFVFLDCYAPSAETRRRIEALKSDGRVLVWLYAAGLYDDGRLSSDGMKALTGLSITMHRGEMALQAAAEGGESWGTDQKADPWFCVNETAAESVARFADKSTAVAMRNFGNWISVYSAVPVLPAHFLRRLAQQAGVHIYVDHDDVVWANRSLLALTVNEGGPRTISVRDASRVTDLFTGKTTAVQDGKFTVDMQPKSTVLWRVDPQSH